MNKSLLNCAIGLLVLGTCCLSGCYVPVRFCFYNNTEETIRIVAGEYVYEVEKQQTVKFAIRKMVYSELIQKGSTIWVYDLSNLPLHLDNDNRVIFVQIQNDGALLFLKPPTKFPIDDHAQADQVLERKRPLMTK